MLERWRQILLEAFVILLLGVLLGLTVNHRRLLAVLDGSAPTAPASTAAGRALPAQLPEPVGLAELRELLAAGALPLDARAPELFAAGHLPGARSLPLEQARLAPDRLAGTLPDGVALVTYCSGYGCSDSFDLAVLLLQAGYRGVRVYEGGLPEWQAAGLPVPQGVE